MYNLNREIKKHIIRILYFTIYFKIYNTNINTISCFSKRYLSSENIVSLMYNFLKCNTFKEV